MQGINVASYECFTLKVLFDKGQEIRCFWLGIAFPKCQKAVYNIVQSEIQYGLKENVMGYWHIANVYGVNDMDLFQSIYHWHEVDPCT